MTEAHLPKLATEVLWRGVHDLVVREELTTAIGAEVTLGALKRLVFLVATVIKTVILLRSDGVDIEVPY